MVDLALMAKLVAAIPPSGRLILLGDKDQLASVEAGAVLADLCNGGEPRRFSNAFIAEFMALTGQKLPAQRGPAGIRAFRLHRRTAQELPLRRPEWHLPTQPGR